MDRHRYWTPSTIVIVTLVFACITRVSAADRCEAILRTGVFDTADILDLHVRHDTVRQISCGGGSSFDLLEGLMRSNDFCSKTFNDFVVVDQYVEAVRRASRVIANAWLDCVKQPQGLVHYFTTTTDPGRFQYTLRFHVIGKPYVSKIKSWSMSPESVKKSCTGQMPQGGKTEVGEAAYRLIARANHRRR